MDAEPRLSVVIPTHNRHERAARTIAALTAQIVADDLTTAVEVIVVDDGSEPDCAAKTAEFIRRQHHSFLRYVALPENQGASGARNAGIQASRGAIVACLDDDILPADDYVRAIICGHERHPEALVINGNLRARRPGVYTDFWFYYYNAVFNRPGETFFTIEMLSSGHFSVKRSLLEREQPLFDTALTSREDFDLYLRLKQQGILSYKDDSILAFIDTRTTLVSFLKQRLWYSRGQDQLVAKHGPSATRRAIAPPNPRFWHLYLLIRLTHRTARYYRAAQRRLAALRPTREQA
jgi:glycosyltransferase involved in cell wall biosynthesis